MNSSTTDIKQGGKHAYPNNSVQRQSTAPDLSNPYAYPENAALNDQELLGDKMRYHGTDPDASFDNVALRNGTKPDPALAKLKSSLWKRAGQLQSTLGSIAGLDSWQESGKRVEEEASVEYQEAEARLNQGEASRLHGEYDRIMGYLNYAVGHVAGDDEMQARANERLQQANKELDRCSHK